MGDKLFTYKKQGNAWQAYFRGTPLGLIGKTAKPVMGMIRFTLIEYPAVLGKTEFTGEPNANYFLTRDDAAFELLTMYRKAKPDRRS